MPLSIVSTEPESSSASQLSVVSSKPVPKVTSADIERIAKQYDVPADLAVGVAHIESANDPLATSNKGAQGIMQLMPATAKRYGVTDSYDPEQNITGGVKYLKDLLKQFGGDREKVLAAYNWGEQHVADGKQVPSSVKQYVKDVSAKAKEHAWSNLKVVSTEPDTLPAGTKPWSTTTDIEKLQKKPLSIVSTVPESQSTHGQEKPKVGDTGATISQQPKSGWLNRMRQSIANTAIGHSLQSEFPHVAEELGLTPSETVQSPTYESHKEQFVAPEYLVSPQSHSTPANVIRGALQATGEFTSAPTLATITAMAATGGLGEAAVPALGRMMSLGFASKSAIDMIKQAPELVTLYHEDPQAFEEELGKLSVNLANTVLMGAHAAGKEIPSPGIKPEFRRVEEAQQREATWQAAPKTVPKVIGSKEEPVVAETDATVGKQLDALKAGTVSTVMIPQGGKVPAVPEGMQSVTVDKGKGAGTYIFDPKKVSAETVRQAAESGKHGELLGHVQSKAEVADKPKVVVQARAADGTPVQESVVEDKPELVAVQTKVLEDRHPDAEVTVTTPQEVVGERAGVPVEKPEAVGEGKEPSEAEKSQEGAPASTEPASVIKVPLGSLVTDPQRFQYKLNVDEKGVSNILKGRKWNPDLAGVVSVWQDPHDEELYVVNGHHRVDLARDNGVQSLDVRVINAPDAATARTVGALQNIAEGRGTAVDAAKFLRDTGRDVNDLEREGITLTEKKAADGVALAKLADPIFQEVATGKMRIGRGVAIGSATDDPAQQEAILKMIEKREKSGKAIPDAVVAELGRMAKGAKDKTETQDTLFGVQSMTRNLLLEKAEVSEYIRKQIGSEKKLFSGVSTESTAQRLGKAGNVIDAEENAKIATQAAQAQELYDRFSVKTGEINDILNRAADELANGESPNAVKQRAYEEVRKTLAETLGKPVEGGAEGVQAGPRTGEAEAHAEPAAGVKQGAVKGPLTEAKLRAELAKHPNITPEQRDAMVTVWKQFSEKYLGMDFDQFLNRYWKDLKVGGEYAGEEGLQQRGAVTWAYHPQKGLLTDRAGRKGHEQLLHEAGVDYMGGRAYDQMPRGRAIVDPYTRSVVVTLQGDSDLTPAAERELRHALDVPNDYAVRTNHASMLFQQQANPVWYSKLERIIGDAPIKSSASGEQWMRMLQNKGVKAAEIEATGLDEFLKGKSKVSRDEVHDFVKANQVEVKEVMKGGDDNVWREEGEPETTKFHTYVTPGGENYRELLLTLPEKVGEVKWEDSGPTKLNLERPGGGYSVVDTRQWTADVNGAEYRITFNPLKQKYVLDGENGGLMNAQYDTLEQAKARALQGSEYKHSGRQVFRGGHFDEPNVLAHVRFNDRTDAQGNKVLFMEEVQSDWHQKGRKQGYKTDTGKEDAQRRLEESYNKVRPLLTKADLLGYDFATDALRDIKSGALQIDQIDETGVPGLREAAAEYRDAYAAWEPFALSKDSQAVPDAPFKKDWHELALRRMLRYAAENGYDKVAWTTGEQQNERYDLSKQVDYISYYKNNDGTYAVKAGPKGEDGEINLGENVAVEKLPDIVGKELAGKIVRNEGNADKMPFTGTNEKGLFEGVDLKVGGSGMKGFYDKIIPDYLNKYGKKFGAKVGKTEIETGENERLEYSGPERTLAEVEAASKYADNVAMEQQYRKIADAMRGGMSFKEALDSKGSMTAAAELGGSAKWVKEPKSDSVHSLDITPELHKAVMEGQPLFQGKAGEVKGATQFMEDGKAIVSLYNSADFSTFAHESFHVMRPHLKPEDTAILEREFGVKDGKWTTAHEETAARSWERYLRDGEAPSPKLADVFAKIKAWMVGIYQHLASTELEKNVSPAVREVFDRMLGKEDSVSAETGEQPRPVDPNQEVMFQRRKRAEAEPSGLLPGMEDVPEERKQAAAEAEGETLTGELTQPKGDISRAAGEMEQKSPLFRGTEASPQNEMFGDEGQTKLFSGIPPPEEFVKQFRTVFPSVAKRFDNWVSDERTVGGEQKATMRQTRGEMDRSLSVVAEKLKSYKKEWVSRPREDFRKFAQAVEGLIPVQDLAPRDQELANIFKSGFDEIRSQIQALKPEVLQSYIEHYFPHIWERPGVAEKAVRNVLASKRPFAGSERFRQKRTVPTVEDGLDLGLKPVSWNPVDMFLLKYKEEAQFLMAHKTLDMMKDNGNAKFVRINQASPEGWVKLDDRIGTVYGKEQVQTVEPGQDELYDEGGKPRQFTVIRGHYWAPPEAAKVFNNFVSRGFAGRYTTYDIAQGLNSNLNALQLGISAFHVTTTSVNAATSDIALGLQQLREGKIVEGATRIGSGVATLPSVANTLRNGSKLMKEYLTPGSYEKFSREANAVEQAGGRAKQQTIQLHALDNFMNAIKNRAYGDAAKAAPSAIIEASVWPVMEYYVPRMKFGAFYNMAHDILERADRENWPEERTRARMQKAWDSVDNRFGQMVYDNLFWKKSVRDSLQLATRSVGWNFGTIRELGGAVPDLIKETARVSKGEAPEISDRVAFAFALAGYTAMVGATMTYLMTGKRPQTWKDYYYPRQADGTRMSIPGYMKDVVSYLHDPKQTVMNKMGPLIELTAEAIQNRDFYGTEIRHKDDPVVKQLWQFAKFVGNTAMPFSISGSKKLVQKAGGDTSSFKETVKSGLRHPGQILAGQLGFQPAPAFIQHSPALNKAYEYEFTNRPPGVRTQAQADHHQYMRQMEDMFRSGKVDQKTIDSLLANNQITHADVRKAKVVSRLDPLAWAAFSLTLEQALNVYKDADEREKKILKPIIIKKRAQISKEPDPDKRAELMRSYLQTVHPQGK